MLRLSKKAEYALMALKDLASRPADEAASAREIAERYGIPIELMAKVLQRLARRHFLASHHGTRGGYHLARPASGISVADVIEAIDGPVMVTACTTADDDCDQYANCNIRDPLWRIKDQIVQALTSYTIQALAADEPALVPISMSRRPSDEDAPLAPVPVESC
ncbi:MAG: transcriptional regulator [Acidobacteria bacterium]|jgi:Rrf2 family protein|nr:transcriptional regulator [Acidobacteriota bacterium]MDP7691712.1 Rrf2 family transcriptional regulator [Vicinamibacterales bacterium]HJN46245.1 Rrf2 family transcriptional regulator [Vicinamibacterales bacterium]|tara:strand:- start:201 stop:689 length:489 start_codon:yes stop_codon:yes gene_type:complete